MGKPDRNAEILAEIETLANEVDVDAEDAIDRATALIKGADKSGIDAETVKKLKADSKALNKAWDDMCDLLDLYREGAAPSASKASACYERYVIALEMLDATNALAEAVVATAPAAMVKGIATFMTGYIKEMQKIAKDVISDVEATDKKIDKAKTHVKQAKAQAAIDLAISAAALAIPPLRIVGTLAAAAGLTATKVIVNNKLGPDGAGAGDTCANAALELGGLADSLSKGAAGLASAAGLLKGIRDDVKEIKKAYKILADA